MPDGDSFGGGSYPSPPEVEEKTVTAKICMSYEIEVEVPKKWDDEEILDFIKENYRDYDEFNETIDDIKI